MGHLRRIAPPDRHGNPMIAIETRPRAPLLFVALLVAALPMLGACHRAESVAAPLAATVLAQGRPDNAGTGDAAAHSADKNGVAGDAEAGVTLKPEEVQKLGVVTETLRRTAHAPQASGFGVVVPHEAIAQSLAELRTASAVARQSHAALERGQRLAGTPGAMPLDNLEAAERQSTVDSAALELARQRLSSAYGRQSPWRSQDNNPLLTALANGELKLVRVTFPMNALGDTPPVALRLGRIGADPTARTWESGAVWSAPADNTVPGRSFFATFKGTVFGEGERLLAWAPVGEVHEGVMIPAPATVISGGRYWCYIEAKPGRYVRTEFDPAEPLDGGYFVFEGFEVGDHVVVKAGGQLLAKELNPATGAE
jgi:hypothetical protein